MTQFATARQLSTYLAGTAVDADLSAEFTAQAELLIRLVSADIQDAAGNTIEAGTGTVFLEGGWTDALELPQRPVRSVSAVSINGVALGATGYTWNPGNVLRRGTRSELLDDGAGGNWGGPGALVAVTYAWGSEDVPDRILSLTLRACSRIIGNPSNLRQETLGIYSATYADLTRDGSHILRAERDNLRRTYNRTAGSFPVG